MPKTKVLPAPKCVAGPQPTKENLLIFEDSRGYVEAILEQAPVGRIGSRRVIKKPWGDYSQDDVRALLSSAKNTTMIIFGASLDSPKSNAVSDVIAFQTIVVRLLFYIIKALVDEDSAIKKLCILTRGMFAEEREIHEQVGLSLVMFSTMFGFCNTARFETEDCAIQLIDTEYFLDPPFWNTQDPRLRVRLASEVFRNQTFGKHTVRILNSGRYVARLVFAHPYADAVDMPFKMPEHGHLICISGGNGALGIVMGMWLVDQAEKQKKGGFEIQFLSRSAKISDVNMTNWKAVQKKADALGIKVSQLKADLSSQEAIDNFLLGTAGRLFGFIHSAGVLQDSMIMNLSWDKFEAVWDPKHRAAYYLHDALGRIPNELSFFWMFSSIAVFGNLGQLNYSASNAALDGLARHRRALGLPAQTMQWGGWGEVGMASTMDAANKRRMDNGPMPTFSTAEGLAGLEEGLRTGVPTFAVFKVNPEAMVGQMYKSDDYTRNWHCEMVPTPAPSSNEDKEADLIHRHLMWPQHLSPNHAELVWDAYVRPVAGDAKDGDYAPTQCHGISVDALTRYKSVVNTQP
jgi:hypothetical protein